MNAAARALTQGNLFHGNVRESFAIKPMLMTVLLLIAVLSSAIAVVYLKNYHRYLFSEVQSLQSQANRLQIEWNQLRVEQSTLANPSRVQEVAQEKFNMHLPAAKEVVIVEQ